MEGYRFQQLAYLVVPIIVGIEFFLSGKAERERAGRESPGALALDALGIVFAGLVPAIFLLTIAVLEFNLFPLQEETLHRLDRYGVMFMFLGAWWQIFLLTGLRARRLAGRGENPLVPILAPYIALGTFISALVLWVAPWNLMWVSILWFVVTAGIVSGLKVPPATTAKAFLVMAGMVFFGENILFLWLDAVV